MIIIPADDRIEDCISIRRKVFVEEQGVPEELEIDSFDEPGSGCFHFLMLEPGRHEALPIGAFRAYYEDETTVHLQRFCILKEYRGKGYGRAALDYVKAHFAAGGARKITFGAQCSAIPFYEKCGCVCVSEVFLDAGIPHKKMDLII
ncbi:MAG: GNAT family N-acetyltransferase [Clostridia bacterium]|nr:GNAT family N-acetyltransferase [Clostridia bacterium]